MANSRPTSPSGPSSHAEPGAHGADGAGRPGGLSGQGLSRRHLLTTGLLAGLAAGMTAVGAGSAYASPFDPTTFRAQGDPDFHPVRFRLPGPSGRKVIGTTAVHLVDQGRVDPSMPSGQRELMVSFWYPAGMDAAAPFAKYMPARTAVEVDDAWTGDYGLALPTGSFDFGNTLTHARVDVPVQRLRHPVVLFSPGYQYSRFVNTAQVEDLASRGYVVVTMDHPHETPVEYPGGRFLPGATEAEPPKPSDIRAAVDTRTKDARFVLDQLERIAGGDNVDAEGKDLPDGLGEGLDLRRIGMFGFGLGGYTTGDTMLNDERILAGADLDGTLQDDRLKGPLGDVAEHGLDRPFLLFASDETQRTAPGKDYYDKSWAQFWSKQRGGRLNLALSRTKQKAFTDYQFIFSQLFHDIYGEDPIVSSVIKALVGGAKPARSVLAQREYLAAYFDLTLRRRPALLLRGDSPKFPEVRFVR